MRVALVRMQRHASVCVPPVAAVAERSARTSSDAEAFGPRLNDLSAASG